jgi:hypothetical protein
MKSIIISAVILLAITAASFGIAKHSHQIYLGYDYPDHSNY